MRLLIGCLLGAFTLALAGCGDSSETSVAQETTPAPKRVTVKNATGYRQLFKPGQTTVKAAKPGCAQYRELVNAWSARARQFNASSRGMGADPFVADRYSKEVRWIYLDQSDAFAKALDRVSRRLLRASTNGAGQRFDLVQTFTVDALHVCGTARAYERTANTLANLDSRANTIIEQAGRKPWYPEGYNKWHTDDVAWRWVEDANCDYFRCWQIQVVARDGCPGSVYAELNIMQGDTVVDYTNDLLGSLGSGEVGVLTFNNASERGSTGKLTEINCY